jgi:hypothetical protein
MIGRLAPGPQCRGRAVTLTFFVLLASCACRTETPREVALLARGMTFVLATAPDIPNPTLHFRAGERVRVVLKNEAPGLLHNFEIPAWNVKVDQLRAGETGEVVFTVPDRPQRSEYRCRPHAELMHAVVEVAP